MLNLLAVCSLLLVPAAYAADQAATTLPVEYELVNDFAARPQTHLQQTSKILEQLRETTDPAERKKLMNAWIPCSSISTAIAIRLLDRPDPGLDRVAKAIGFSLRNERIRIASSLTRARVQEDW